MNFTALVVEDDTLQREALADLLKDEGLEVIECTSAEAAELVVASAGPELKALITEVAEAVPEAKLTDDVAGRRSDITWDIGEHQYLAMDRVDRIVAIILHAGARTTRSSVHVHATFDVDDKASGAISFLAGAFGEDAGSAVSRYAFIGDSGNDAACFGGFAVTFGVANVKASLRRIAVPPRYVASLSMGEGFAEVATTLLSLRAGAPSAPQRGVDELEVRANRA